MNNAIFNFERPKNEPILSYKSCSPERIKLEKELENLANTVTEIPLIIGGKEIRTGVTETVRMLNVFGCAKLLPGAVLLEAEGIILIKVRPVPVEQVEGPRHVIFHGD